MADTFFCRECGETVIWGERVRRWVHETAPNDHAITLAKRGALPGEGVPDDNPLDHREPEDGPLSHEREMIGDPLTYLNNVGTTGTLDGDDDGHEQRRWIDLRYLIDRAWGSVGGKPCPIT